MQYNVYFSAGKFDNYCVYVKKNNTVFAPRDTKYFTFFQSLAQDYGKEKIYADFLIVYVNTTNKIEPNVISLIKKISKTYNEIDREQVELWLTVIYYAMVAEENKENAVLKKRIKALGMYQTLILDMPPEQAAKYSYGKNWKELDKIMKSFNIF